MNALRRILGDGLRILRTVGRHDDQAAIHRLFHLLRQPKYQPGKVTWRGRTLHYTDGPALYYQLGDIYQHHVYDFGCEHAAPRILDIGANLGLATIRFRELFPAARITAFEADPSIGQVLKTNLETFGDKQTEVITAAAWISEGHSNFKSNGDDSGHLAADGGVQIPTVDLAAYCRETIDFMKLDVEGAEFDLIAHLQATNTLRHVRRLFVEMHAWDPAVSPRFHDLLAVLASAGFHYRITSASTFPHGAQGPSFDTLKTATSLATVHAWRQDGGVA